MVLTTYHFRAALQFLVILLFSITQRDSAGKRRRGADFLAISGSPFSAICAIAGGSSALGDAVARPRDDRQKDLLQPALEEIMDLGHALVRLPREIDWGFLDRRFAVCARRVRVSLACRPGLWWACSS